MDTRSRRLRLTVIVEYSADPDMYGTDDSEEMAVLDREQIRLIADDVGDEISAVAAIWGANEDEAVDIRVEPA